MHKFFETYMEVTLTALSGLISITIFVFFMYNNLTSTIKANQNIFNDGNFKGQITVNDIRSQERMVIYINDYLLDDSDFQSIVVHKGEENFDFYALASYLNNDNGKVPFTKDNDSFALKSDISGIDIQIYLMEKDTNKTISNVVLMGSGEPLDNYHNTLKFLNIIHDEKGHNISLRNITISTCGVVPKIYELAKENLPITLSISLHSPFDEERAKIMPIARKYKLKDLMEACKYYSESTNRRLTYEYTLIENVNDGDKEIQELAKLLKGINGHINLIPLNPINEYREIRPNRLNIEKFQKKLLNRNIPATIRREMGNDISASCGQLRRSITDIE